MRIVCAPDSFKESMTALEAARAMAEGVRRVVPGASCDLVPMADGGEGTTAALIDALGGALIEAPCHDALGRPITGVYGFIAASRLAVIEMAAASGLALIPPAERDVLRATSAGTGELIRDALDRGARRFIVGIGGSATNDAGAGLFSALGVRFLDGDGVGLPPGGAALAGLAAVDLGRLDPRLADTDWDIACDVDNPLLGPRGATAVFGPQKGATSVRARAALEAGLTRWADVVERTVGRCVRDLPGAGASGGLGASLAAFLPAPRLRPGVQIVAEAVDLAGHVRGANWVFTGEGSIDAQTLRGKTPLGVLDCARRAGVRVIMFGGRVAHEAYALLAQGVTALVPITPPGQGLTTALEEGPRNLADAVETTVRRLLDDPETPPAA